MKSSNYTYENHGFTALLAGLTHGILAGAAGIPKTGTAPAPIGGHGSWLDRLDDWCWKQEVKSREAFLAQSVDIVDLERRIRWLERGYS
jgi:hypothetical protein